MVLDGAVVAVGPLSEPRERCDIRACCLLMTSKQEINVEELKLGQCVRDLRLRPLQRTLTLFIPSCCLILENVKLQHL